MTIEETEGGRTAPGVQLVSFAYATSKSGKTTYYSPALLRNDLESDKPGCAMIQGFMILPAEDTPFGVLNRPNPAHKDRIHEPDRVRWDVWEQGLKERLLAVVEEVNNPEHLRGADACRACGARWVAHTIAHDDECTYIRATDDNRMGAQA